MAERLLQHGLDQIYPGAFEVRSAGTGALAGHPIEAHVEGFIRVMGASADDFVARQLTPGILAEQDLVIALTRAHRSRIVEMRPALLKKTFTLRELARILPTIGLPEGLAPAERWEAMIPLAIRARSMQRVPPEEDDVVDPYRRDDNVYEQMRGEVMPTIGRLVSWTTEHS